MGMETNLERSQKTAVNEQRPFLTPEAVDISGGDHTVSLSDTRGISAIDGTVVMVQVTDPKGVVHDNIPLPIGAGWFPCNGITKIEQSGTDSGQTGSIIVWQ